MKNQRWLRKVRISVALLFFSGFIIIFSDVTAKLPWELTVSFTYFQLIPSFIRFINVGGVLATGFIIILFITFLSGRVYCSVFCPLGIMQDILAFLRRKIPFLSKMKLRFKKPLNILRYSILALFIISLFFTGIISVNLLDPYANFGRIASNLYQPFFIAANNILSKILMAVGISSIQPIIQKIFYPLPFLFGLTIFLLISVMVFFRYRLFCNSICPVGAILGLVSKVSFLKIRINSNSCTRCGNCQVVCKTNCINIKNLTIDESRCVSCFNCITSCNDESIGYKNTWRSFGAKSLETTSSSKRDFIKAGLLFFAVQPIFANTNDDHDYEKGSKGRFCQRGPISPPGSLNIEHLKDYCVGCQLCISVCPSKVLQPAFLEYGFIGMMLPRMNNKTGFCNYECTRCGEVCPTGAITALTKEQKETVQIGKVYFKQNLCIVESEGTACGSCSEHCPTQAVHMVPYKNELTIPEINPDICVGCGACEYACPVEDPHVAIWVIPNKVHEKAQKPQIQEQVETGEIEDFPF
ncbi:MAG: 4Fe-4S binding protein [Bacteroidales bacterium]|nr:4Fe-4S binding protein [Bacteroidales bacterium]